MRTAGSYTFSYDCNGNQTARNVGTSYSLSGVYPEHQRRDAENRLTQVSGGATASFVYDGDGRRVKATIGTSTTAYVGDYFEWKDSPSSRVKYDYAGGQRVALRENTTLYWLLSDHLGITASRARRC